MADLVGEYSVNNTLILDNTISLNGVKNEYQDADMADYKVDISETSIIKDNSELQDQLLPEMKQHEICNTWDNVKTELSLPEVKRDMIHDKHKIEEGISTDIKIELNNGFLYCEDCQVYYEEYCTQCGMLVHILNRTVMTNDVNKSQKELPRDDLLEIQDYFGGFHIHALRIIPVGVQFGPFVGLSIAEHPLKIKSGKFVVNKEKSNHLNWMQYINPARNISEQNLLVFQYEHNLYYQSTRQIQVGDELLVYFGEEYNESLNKNVEMNFTPTTKHIFKEAFACTFCCLGFSSKFHLVKHKTICLKNVAGGFSIKELMQCPSCKIHLDRKEYIVNHMGYCCKRNDRKYILPTPAKKVANVNGLKVRPRLFYRCQQCRCRTKYKGDLWNHANQHYKVKMYKCGICYKRFKRKEILKLHVRTAHIGAGGKENSEQSTGDLMNTQIRIEYSRSQDKMKQFKCSKCEFRAKYKTHLKIHFKSKHFKVFKYKCNVCHYTTNWKTHLNIHIETRHLKEVDYKCDICEYKTNFPSNLNKRIAGNHLKVYKHKCDTCNYKSNYKSDLNRHIETKHLKEFKYKCDTCEYKTNYKSALKKHIVARHLKDFKHKCDICGCKTKMRSDLKRHIERKHLKEFKYKCDTCDYKSNFKSDLKKHVEGKHLKEFKHKCDICDYKSNFKSDLKKHVEGKHLKEFKHKCDICEYKSNYKYNLKTHIETKHLKEFKYKCDTCEYKTNFKSDLKKHIEGRHLKEFKHKCDICEYKTNFKPDLKRHIVAKHLKDFEYKCDTCGYKTNFKSDLNRHIETKHLKECKHKCDICEYKTNYTSHLKQHIAARHLRDFKYKCDICGYKSNVKVNLKRHIEGKHLKEFKHK